MHLCSPRLTVILLDVVLFLSRAHTQPTMQLLRSHWSHFNGELVFTLIWRVGGWGGGPLAGSQRIPNNIGVMNGCMSWWYNRWHRGFFSYPLPHPAFQLHHRRDGCAIYFLSPATNAYERGKDSCPRLSLSPAICVLRLQSLRRYDIFELWRRCQRM